MMALFDSLDTLTAQRNADRLAQLGLRSRNTRADGSTIVHLRLPAPALAQLDAAANELALSRSALVTSLLNISFLSETV